jgi:hypothetical protein
MIAYLVDAGARTITAIDYQYDTMRQHLPGGLCLGTVFENGDVLYVDDEGCLRPATVAFRIRRRPDGQPMMSNGLLTGRDDHETTLPPEYTIEQLQAEIEWLTIPEALAWFEAMAKQPCVISRVGDDPVMIHAVWADLLRNLKGGDGYHPMTDERLIKGVIGGRDV